MRSFIYGLLADPNPAHTDAAALHAIVVVDRIRSSGAGDVNTSVSLPTPFIMLRGLSEDRVFRGAVRQSGVQIHVHDSPDSYVRIDAIKVIIEQIMDSVVPQQFGTKWVMDVVAQGWSEDLYDDHYGTATRYGTYGITARH